MLDPTVTLRAYLNERIPPEGTPADTMFSDIEINDILTFQGAESNLYFAAAEGWTRKMAAYADLVTVGQSGATRNMSDLRQHAQDMAEYYRELAQSRRSTKVGRIVRAGTTVY